MVKWIVILISFFCAAEANCQYRGGDGDGFASIELSVESGVNELKVSSAVWLTNGYLYANIQAVKSVVLYTVDGKLVTQAENFPIEIDGNNKILLYRIETKTNAKISGKIWVE